MYIKTILVLLVIGTTFGGSLIGITNFFNNPSIYNNHQAFATHMETATSNEKSVVPSGIIASIQILRLNLNQMKAVNQQLFYRIEVMAQSIEEL